MARPALAPVPESLKSSPEASQVPEASWTEELGWDDRRVLVVEPTGMRALGTAAAMAGYLWIPLESPRPSHRGKLALYIEECIECALQARGAPFPGVGASTDLDASLGDQLYRARLVEMRGIALGLPDLGGIVNLGGVLDAEDSAALRWWVAAAMDRPVRVVLSADNRRYRIYPSPVAFGALLDGHQRSFSDAPSPRAPSTETAQSVAAMELSDLPPGVEPRELSAGKLALGADVDLPELDRALGLTPEPESDQVVAEPSESGRSEVAAPCAEAELSAEAEPSEGAERSAEAEPSKAELSAEAEPSEGAELSEEHEDDTVAAVLAGAGSPPAPEAALLPEVEADDAAPEPQAFAPAASRPVVKSAISMEAARRAAAARRRPFIVSADDEGRPEAETEHRSVHPESAPPCPLEETPSASPAPAEGSSAQASPDAPAGPAPTQEVAEDPFDEYARENYKGWIRDLEAARGPKPLAHIERLFVTGYTRLDAAVQRGIGEEGARQALEQWRSSFSKSYQDAFDALRLRGKRPTMVLDVPELAQRVGRLHGARRVQLLLVDGMRFDLGMMVQDRLKLRPEASLTERMLLWSALPTTTTNQLELIGKGADGLREMGVPRPDEEPEVVVARGGAAHTLRRIRTGRRELFKLDIVEAALREGAKEGPLVRARMPALADDVARVVGDHFSKQVPRTLVMVFGDHGFRLHDDTGEVTQGGTSPEEVLVPAFAWLTGAVH